MNLPNELYQATVEALRMSVMPDNATDGRIDARQRLLGSATIIPCSTRRPVVVGICDLSAGGIGIVHSMLLRVGEEFILAIPATISSPRRAALFTVVHWNEHTADSFRIGATLLRELTVSNEEGRSSRPDRRLTPVEGLAAAFRDQAARGLSTEEVEQVRQLEQRLAAMSVS